MGMNIEVYIKLSFVNSTCYLN